MFEIDNDMTIYVTRGDVAYFTVTAEYNGTKHKFQKGDIVRIKVTQKKNCDNVAFQKDFLVAVETEAVDILLTEEETKIGETISKAVDYWYEVELNPYTNPQTIIGYDEDGPKIFKLYPEGRDLGTVEAEDIPLVDKELSLTSERPIQNQAVARALISYEERVELAAQRIEATANEAEQTVKTNTDGIVENAIGEIALEANNYISTVQSVTDTAIDNINGTSSKGLADIQTASDEAVERVQDASTDIIASAQNFADEAGSSAVRAEEAAERAQTAAGFQFDTELNEYSENLITNKPVAKAINEIKDGYLSLEGGVSVKRAARTVFGVENTALEKASLSYWGKGVFMGELGITATDGTQHPFFRDKSGTENTLVTTNTLSTYAKSSDLDNLSDRVDLNQNDISDMGGDVASLISDVTGIKSGSIVVAKATNADRDGDGNLIKNTYSKASHTHYYADSSTPSGAATKAVGDGNGNNIVNTYATKASLGTQVTYSLSGTTLTITTK